MGGDTLDKHLDRLEDLIVEAFKRYEAGLMPLSMRHETRNIINAAFKQEREK